MAHRTLPALAVFLALILSGHFWAQSGTAVGI